LHDYNWTINADKNAGCCSGKITVTYTQVDDKNC